MSRPTCCRRIASEPAAVYFKPCGVPLGALDEIVVGLDEIEALRLADLEGLYQEAASTRMNVSRPTFARIVESARRKVAEALVKGKILKLEGGNVMFRTMKRCRHAACRHSRVPPQRDACPDECPKRRSPCCAASGSGGARRDDAPQGKGGRRRRGSGRSSHKTQSSKPEGKT
jgi:uncharacterized protein